MKNQFSLDIKKPCLENFNTFRPTEMGGFCDSCNKEVVDFTSMNSKEIITFFKNKNKNNTCGRFNSNQLTTYNKTPKKNRTLSFISSIGLACLTLFSFSNSYSQELQKQNDASNQDPSNINDVSQENEIEVKGTVLDENGLPLPGVNIIQKGTTNGTQTNFDGEFKFPEKLNKGDVLSFSFLGYETREIIINSQNSKTKIQMEVNMDALEFVVMGKVATKGIYKSK
ncbi:carboxypeptidase-like regulatory domain-containing protein [Hanstruepera flava]|uniref:carboxypeptidase-like regulatory domain-containing protein n=1 Tax=Hanstruepera flava TaxID=2930218 RepID=UPI002028A43D|nr:carboxypeptidase-like regulatory domain-containing protein [Hanstruepera flava]